MLIHSLSLLDGWNKLATTLSSENKQRLPNFFLSESWLIYVRTSLLITFQDTNCSNEAEFLEVTVLLFIVKML